MKKNEISFIGVSNAFPVLFCPKNGSIRQLNTRVVCDWAEMAQIPAIIFVTNQNIQV